MARKNISIYGENELYKQVQHIAIELEKTINELMEEGMQMVIDKYADKIELDLKPSKKQKNGGIHNE